MSARSIESVAWEGVNLSRDNARALAAHEDLCAERYANIHDKLGMIFKIISWAGGTAFLIMFGLLAFLAKTQFEQIQTLQEAVARQQSLGASVEQRHQL